MHRPMAWLLRHRLERAVGLGALYWVSASLAHGLSLHPDLPPCVWLASGIAVAGVLIWGPGVWPGLPLGAILLGIPDILGAATMADRLATLSLYAALGAGATAQALAGRALVTRHAGFPCPLDRLAMMKMLILAGPVACLVNPTVGVTLFAMSGRLVSGVGATWCLWWISDFTGVVSVLLIVSAWAQEMEGATRRIRWYAVISSLVVITVILGGFWLYRDRNEKIVRGDFERHAALISQTIRHQLKTYVDVLHSVGRLFYSNGEVDRVAFRRFVQPFLGRHSGIQALEWVPKVSRQERFGYEAHAKSEGFPDFELTELVHGAMVRAAEREVYYPVYYMEPHEGNERALGYDLGSNPVRLKALNRAMALADPTLSKRLVLVQEKENQFGFLVFVPVYWQEAGSFTKSQRFRHLRGFALGVFRIGDMMADALKHVDLSRTGLRLVDAAAHEGEQCLWRNGAGTLPSGLPACPELLRKEPLVAHGRNWELSIWPRAEYIRGERFFDVWMLGVGGALLGGGLCAFLFTLLGRTEQLFRANANLNQEVGERHVAQESLRRVRKRLEFILNASPTVTYIARPNGDYGATFVSDNVQQLCGYPASRFIEDPCFCVDHIHDDDRERVYRAMEDIAETGRFQADYRFCRADGGHLWVHDQALLVRDGQGTPVELIGTWADITDRQNALSALQASEERFGVAFKCNPGAMAIFSLETGSLVDVNDSFTDMLAVHREDVIGQSVAELGFFEDAEFFQRVVRQIHAGPSVERAGGANRVHGMEAVFQRGTGETGTCLFSSALITIDEQPCVLAVLSDITRRIQAEGEKAHLEKMLRQSQKLEAIGTLAGGIAHDFNNILSVIIGYSELALEAATEPELQSDLNAVMRAGQRARDLIAQILAFSRQSDQEMRPVRLKYIVEEVLTLLKASLPSYIEIRKQIECGAMVMGDPTQIHQVLMNLCTNAGHAMPDGGTLEVALTVRASDEVSAVFSGLKSDACVELSVRDTGLGMPPEVAARIFEPYFTTKKKSHGTGLGLSVAHGIVKNHGGDIRVESAPGQGSTFRVYLPVIDEDEEERGHQVTPLPRGTERILFVDDEPSLAGMAQRMLESLGYRVTIRTCSLEALELFRSRPDDFDLLITDMTMPHMTGEFLVEAILRIRAGFPAILCTGFSERLNEKQANLVGVGAYVFKPILKPEIAAIIRQVLDGPR